MKKYFLRSFFAVTAAILLSMVLVNHVAFMSVMRQIENTPGGTMKLFAGLGIEDLKGMTMAQARAYLEEKGGILDSRVEFLEPSSQELDEGVIRDLIDQGIVVRRVRSGFNHGLKMYIPVQIEGRELILAAGPVSRPYGPDFLAYLYMALLVLTVITLSTMVVSLPMWRRLRILEKTAKSISDGHLDARIPISSDDAMVGFVASQFNTMVTRIEQLLASQKMMLQAVCHELRTPTARIRFGLEMLEEAGSQQERERRLDAIDEDLTDLDDLVEELLIFNKTEALGTDIDTTPVDVSRALEVLVEKRRFLRPGVEIGIDFEDRDLHVMVEQRSFMRAIGNLLSNALRFTKTGVWISVRRDGDSVRIAVDDDGPGVPVMERSTILEPFKRLDTSRNRESGGAGLGLAIVSSIVSAHGGRIEIFDSPSGGASFMTWWPST